MIKKAVPIILVLVFSFSCGKKGPLKLEPGLIPKAVENFQVQQVGKQIKLQWDFPPTLQGRTKTELEINKIDKIYVYYSTKEILGGKFEKKSKLLRKLQLEDLTEVTDSTKPIQNQTLLQENFSYYAMIPFTLNELDNKNHFFGILYYYQKKKSPISRIAVIDTLIPVKPVTGLAITRENKLIKLNWTRPGQDEAGNTVATIAGYNVSRKIEPGDEEKSASGTVSETKEDTAPIQKEPGTGLTGFQKINEGKVLVEYFEDMDTGSDGTYSYYVSTIISNRIESEPSPPVSVTVTDIYPPETPANLVSFRASDHMYLTWKGVNEADLAFYRVYRRPAAEDEFRLLADNITANHYKDNVGLVKGETYFYVVTAIDQKGNESEYSLPVKERF